jgi:hypothetical protein
MVLSFYLIMEFGRWVDGGVDWAAEGGFGLSGGGGDFSEGGGTDDHEIEIAGGMFIAAGDGAVNEGGVDFLHKRSKYLAENCRRAEGFANDAAEFGEEGAGGVGLEVDMAATFFSEQDAGVGELLEFALDMAHAEAGGFDDFAEVEAFARVGVEESEDGGLGGAKKR